MIVVLQAVVLLIAHPGFLNQPPRFATMMFALASLVAVSLPLLWQLPMGVNMIFGAFMLLRIALLYKGVRSLKTWQNGVLLLGVFLLVMQQLGTIFGLQGGVSFLLLLALLKSYEGRTRRDWQIMVVVMMFLLTGAILFDEGLFTGLWTLLCLILMACTLALCNEVVGRDALRHSLTAFGLTLLPMVVLFIAMPRSSTPFGGLPQHAAEATTGMSDRMKPGSIGELVLSNQPAFTATFANGVMPRPQDLYWRVMVLGLYNGNEWQVLPDAPDNAQAALNKQIRYEILMEDDKGRIPALDYANMPELRGFVIQGGNAVRVLSRQGVRRFTLTSSLSDELPHQLTPQEIQLYTLLPKNTNLKTHTLAKELYQQSGGDTLAFVQAAYQYFQKQKFTYTLKPPVLGTENATDRFLFESRQGFCEHYADAFVTLMRAAGVPARVVVGYQGGEYDVDDNFWQIRSKDAHAWAEVWLADRQVWKRIDPTGAVSSARIDNGVGGALADEVGELVQNTGFFTQLADRGRFYWQQWVVNYDTDRQQNLFGRLGLGRVRVASVLALLILGGALAAVPLWLWWRKSKRQAVVSPMAQGFSLLKSALLGDGFTDLPSVAPFELCQYLSDNGQLSPDVDALLREYVRLNYRQAQVSRQEALQWYGKAKRLARKYRRTQPK